jgi:DNA-repair protein XRCC1
LENASEIQQIDIQNESSAFIEVLVGNSQQSEDDFETILPAVSFMTPNESKSSNNKNRVKFFTYEDCLVKNLIDKKWERVKIVCTQPFNNDLQFGISYIKLYNKIILSDESKDAVS